MTVMYWIVGHLGTAETAAVNVLINLMLTLVLPCMGMGLAAGAFSGRALGRGDAEDATRWPWDVAKLTAAMMFGVGLIAVLFPTKLLGVSSPTRTPSPRRRFRCDARESRGGGRGRLCR